jgi:DNA-binding response OmpR family regulator
MDKPLIFQEKILVVDDDKNMADMLLAILSQEGLVECASNGEEALGSLDADYCAAIITAVEMPVMNGIEFYNRAVKKYPHIKERFLFLVEDTELTKYISFFEKNNLKYRVKTSQMEMIREAVTDILNR